VINWVLTISLSILGLVPVTYLLTNAYLSRRKARVERVAPGDPSDLTIVVPVHGEDPDRFAATVTSVARQGCRGIVVGDGVVEPYATMARSAGLEFVAVPGRGGKKRALAAGLERVTTPFVLFLDSDTTLPDGGAAQMSTYFAPEVGGVGANLLHPESTAVAAGCAEFVERAREVVLRAMSSRGNVLYLDGACMMFRTELIRAYVASDEFQRLTVFGRETPLGDDWLLTDFVLSQGLRTVKAYDVGAITQAPATIPGFLRQNARWMRSSWIRLGRYVRGAGPRDPGLFYRLELLGTYALPLVTLALVIGRIPLYLHLADDFAGHLASLALLGIRFGPGGAIQLPLGHVIFSAQTVAGLVGTGVFLGAVVDHLPPQRRLRTLACGLLASTLLFGTAIYGLVTVWRTSSWRDPPAPATTGRTETPAPGYSAGGLPFLRR
jgi:cellulose synthase/poly-beta-1,6-N-acetylglucosamine synthase-like glycosyltransferase